jgi:hypothetical protein
MSVADACYANDFCASLEQVGLREMIEENRGWVLPLSALPFFRSCPHPAKKSQKLLGLFALLLIP